MEHEEFLDLIDEKDASSRLESHLAGCRSCRGYARRSAALSRLAASEPEPRRSEAFVGAVLESLPPKPREFSRPIWWLPALSFAAAGAFFLLRSGPLSPAMEAESLLAADYDASEVIEFELSELSDDLEEDLDFGFEEL